MSYFGKFFLTGPDAKKAADWLFTADVNKKPGRCCSWTHTHTDTHRRRCLLVYCHIQVRGRGRG